MKERLSLEQDEDRELLDEVLGGRLELFHELVGRHEAAIFRGALAILGNTADAEDAVQETFLRAFRSLKRFRGEAKFRTWLIQIAVNVARTKLKQLQREGWHLLNADAFWHLREGLRGRSPEEEYSWKELGRMIAAVFDGLQPQYRSVLYMRDIENLSTGATALALGVTEENVRTRLRRARAHLRNRMQQVLTKSHGHGGMR
jgi:RNA polymerase sigma-70 factor (ECF subfamily)